MTKPTDIRIIEATCDFEAIAFRTPLKFGGRVTENTTLINVEVTVENSKGDYVTGFGSMPIGNIWAWPSADVAPDAAEAAMAEFAKRVVSLVESYPEFGHPIDIMFGLAAEYHHLGRAVAEQQGLDEAIPELAQLVAASPTDAAVHDAFGRINGINAFNALSSEYMTNDLAEYLDEQFAGEYLDAYTLRDPKPSLPLYHLIGALDPLTDSDVETPIDDELPETLPEWIAADGLTHLKIKLNGDDLDWDVNRVLAIEAVTAQAQAARGCEQWCYSTDFNEKCENVEYVLAFLAKVREGSEAAWERIQYIEQPTSRDLKAHPDVKMHEAAAIKPVVIDEALVDYESLLLCREQGYSGVALKACKGQTESLLLGAAAQKFDMFLCVQDLTCPGASFLHSASLAARIPGVQAIEGNGRQYCPEPNRAWAKQFPGMFEITDGTVATAELAGIGLGF
jgi:L-alanine-DL-glutamate epimerase-like enolase superfamily enzyme